MPLLRLTGTTYTFSPLLNTFTLEQSNCCFNSFTTSPGLLHFVNTNNFSINLSSNFLLSSFSSTRSDFSISSMLSSISFNDSSYQSASLLPCFINNPPLHTSAYSNAPIPKSIRSYCSFVLVDVGMIIILFFISRNKSYVLSVIKDISLP